MLTNTQLRSLKPRVTLYRMADGHGLCVEVRPNGSKLWRYRYRHGGVAKMISLGAYPEVTLAEARQKHAQARKALHGGVDPSEQRRHTKAAAEHAASERFEAIAREWYAVRSPDWAPSHANKVIRRLERDIFPFIGHKIITTISGPELLAVVLRVAKRGAKESARRELSCCGQIFRYAIAGGRAESDLTRALWEGMPKANAKHLVSQTDPKRVGDLLRLIWNYEGTPVVAAALRLGPYTFTRPGELRAAQWADINLEAAEWRFTASKTGAEHIVPLSLQAVEVLRELHPLTGHGRFVFPSARGGGRAMSNMAVNAALRRVGVDKEMFTGHGWRACARTILDEVLNFRPDFIEHQLAHAVRDPNRLAYNRTKFLPERRKMMQSWADYLDNLRTAGNVIPLHGKRA
jgi:integrase